MRCWTVSGWAGSGVWRGPGGRGPLPGTDASRPSTVFTDDARPTLPIGDIEGVEPLAAFHLRAEAKFDRTPLSSTCLTDPHGDRATVRFRMLATRAHHGVDGADGLRGRCPPRG
ncbi:hypothetical protein GCM10027160_09210 [Streptomyces calidiresistens]|uniref:Uncharacterized protein n=1 Tax=Streptomyces calidiresistens TaxID=1485586 RepID=A0A7W3SZ22_9ACTN|nr:hypothetical protein [Streptomyces calidiresistens]MBB0227944.1 hypothetical protein [Streptomyces calidiresistens]